MKKLLRQLNKHQKKLRKKRQKKIILLKNKELTMLKIQVIDFGKKI